MRQRDQIGVIDRSILLDPMPSISLFGISRQRILRWVLMEQARRKVLSNARDRKLLQGLLRAMRMEAGLLQTDVAHKLKQHQSFVSKYESGERRLDILQLRSICDVLGVSLLDFVKRLERTLKRSDCS